MFGLLFSVVSMAECLGTFEILSVGNRIAIQLMSYAEEDLGEKDGNGMGEVALKILEFPSPRASNLTPANERKVQEIFPGLC